MCAPDGSSTGHCWQHRRLAVIEPVQLTANVGGMANEVAPGVWEYVGGQSDLVEMTINGAVLEAIFPTPAIWANDARTRLAATGRA